jgi:hypothetical protein
MAASRTKRAAKQRRRQEARARRAAMDNFGLDPQMWTAVRRMTRREGQDMHQMPLEGKVLLNQAETLSQVFRDRQRLQGKRLLIREDVEKMSQLRDYLRNVPYTPTGASRGYVKGEHLDRVASGKARGRDFMSRKGAVHIDISWYAGLAEGDRDRLAGALEEEEVRITQGKQGQVALLLKDGRKPMSSSNVRGITVASHLSKVEPTAYYATREPGIYDRVLGGP